jgi:hypothetical protein
MTEEEQRIEFVERWRRAGPALEAIHLQALREYRHDDHIGEIDALLEIGSRLATPRITSGFVEQQRLFLKARQ